MRIHAIVFLDEIQRLHGFHVAYHRHRRVVGPVEGVVELAQLRDGHRLDVALPADRGMVVGQCHVRRLRHLLQEHRVGIVLAAFVFVAHHRHLRLPVGLAQPQMAHAIGFDGDIAFQAFAADGREVIGAVEGGAGIELAADAFQELLDAVALRVVEALAALEHHVLEDVRRAGDARHLVARPDLIGHLKRHHRRGVIGHQQHGESIAVEPVLVYAGQRLHEAETRGHAGGGRRRGRGRGCTRRRGRGGSAADQGKHSHP